MPEPADQPAPPLRTWGPMALWTAAILLALGLAWFIGAVASSFLQARAVAREPGGSYTYCEETVKRLGGPDRAVRSLRLYLMLSSDRGSRAQDKAVGLIAFCGKPGVPALAALLKDKDRHIRRRAACALGRIGSDAAVSVPALATALGDRDEEVVGCAVRALGDIGPASVQAAPQIEKLLTDENDGIRSAAAEALKKIRGEEAGN